MKERCKPGANTVYKEIFTSVLFTLFVSGRIQDWANYNVSNDLFLSTTKSVRIQDRAKVFASVNSENYTWRI